MTAPPGQLLERLIRLETEIAELREQLAASDDRPALRATPQQVWVAVTTTDDSGDYPPPGSNTYPIVFADPDFDKTIHGAQTIALDPNDSAYQNIAALFSTPTSYLPVNTPVFVVEIVRKYYIVHASGDNTLRFELTTALPLGGQAMAQAVIWSAAQSDYVATGAAFPIYDFHGRAGAIRTGKFSGWPNVPAGTSNTPGYRGFARYGDRGAFEVIEMERQARFISFELTNAFSAGQSQNALVTAAWDGVDPPDTVTLQDTAGVWDKAPAGNSAADVVAGYAAWDEEVNAYIPLNLNPPRWFQFKLKENMGATDPDQAAASILDLETGDWWRDDIVRDRCGDPAQPRAFADYKAGRYGLCFLERGKFYIAQGPCNATEAIS